jgi:DNA-binding Lrp family transcriptional regulator
VAKPISAKAEIANILQNDAHTPVGEIAERLGISRRRVTRLVRELEAEGVIVKYTARIDWSKAEERILFAFIEVSVRPERDTGFGGTAGRIARFPEVHSLYLVAGDYDLLAVVTGRSIQDIADFVAQRLSPLEGVERTVTRFVLQNYKVDGHLLIDTEEEDGRLPIVP